MKNITYTIIVILIAVALGMYFQQNINDNKQGDTAIIEATSPVEAAKKLEVSDFQTAFVTDFRQDKNNLKAELESLTSILNDELANVKKLIAAQDNSESEGIKVVLFNELNEAQLQKAILNKKMMALDNSNEANWVETKESIEAFLDTFDEEPTEADFGGEEELAADEYNDLSS